MIPFTEEQKDGYYQTSQDTGRIKSLFLFLNSNFSNDYTVVGSMADYFLIDYPLSKVRDIDIILNKSYLQQVKNLKNISNWNYQGDLRYVGESKDETIVYKSNLIIKKYVYEIDWMFGITKKTIFTRQNNIFEGIPVYSSDRNYRIEILKKLSTINQPENSFRLKAKLKLSSYINKTVI